MALTMASCGGGGGAGSTTGDTINIGIKYDQPGLGQKVGEDYKGLDVDVARYVAKELGFEGDKVIFKETPSAQRETAIQGGQVALIFATYSITGRAQGRRCPSPAPTSSPVKICSFAPTTPTSPVRTR